MKWALLAPNEGGITFVDLWSGPKTLLQWWQVKTFATCVHQCYLLGVQGTCLEMHVLGRGLCVTSRLCYIFPFARKCVQHQHPSPGSPPYFCLLPFFCEGVCVLLFPLPSFTSGSPLSPSAQLRLFHLTHTATLHSPCLPPTLSSPSITIPLFIFPGEEPFRLSTC